MRPLYFKQKGEVELAKLTAAPELKGSSRQTALPSPPTASDCPKVCEAVLLPPVPPVPLLRALVLWLVTRGPCWQLFLICAKIRGKLKPQHLFFLYRGANRCETLKGITKIFILEGAL